MRVTFSDRAWEDHLTWQMDRTVLKKLHRMISEASRDPAFGIGKPERLAHNLSGLWSRRLTDEHRFVYQVVDGDHVLVAQCRYHY